MSSVELVLNDLKNKFNHNFSYIIYEQHKDYAYTILSCKECSFENYIYIGRKGYSFDRQLNFKYIINIDEVEYAYAYDVKILTCKEQIIKNILE